MVAYETGAFVLSKYYTSFYKTPLKWTHRSKSGASKSRPHWAAHTSIGNIWEYPPGDPKLEGRGRGGGLLDQYLGIGEPQRA